MEQVEGWAEEATEALCTCLEQQRKLQIKVLDLESRSRRNNMRVFGVPEGQEGDSVTQFIEKLLRTSPRAIIVNFLEFSTKVMILREVWKKGRIQVGTAFIHFDHDYAPEIVKRRREYNTIKKILKDKGIRFQTLFTNMRIHWETDVCTYSSAREVYKELKRRGFQQEHDKF
uniref:Uncharacterized protein n=1 Tax=Cyprinus carpio TaxID=7962 RepID=A0A8C2KIC3_CYPCA